MKIILKLGKFNYYKLITLFKDCSVWTLSEFLWSFDKDDDFISWLKDPLNRFNGIDTEVQVAYYGEVKCEKLKNNIKLNLWFYENYNKDLENNYLLIPIDQFVYITEKWLKLKNLNMPYIIITEENNKYDIEALDELTPEDQLLVDSNND